MKNISWPVIDKHLSKIGNPEECTYCKSKIKEEHQIDCVQRKRSVVVEMKINIVMEVPEDWDEEMINFHKNDSSWCADSIYLDLKNISKNDGCLCNKAEFNYIREAEKEEHEHYKKFKLNETP